MQKRIESIPAASMNKLAHYHWPGNIRELENFIERAVILTPGNTLQVPVAELSKAAAPSAAAANGNPREYEDREEILRILRETNGRVGGTDGAASRMAIKRTTLISRMKKLGIDARRLS